MNKIYKKIALFFLCFLSLSFQMHALNVVQIIAVIKVHNPAITLRDEIIIEQALYKYFIPDSLGNITVARKKLVACFKKIARSLHLIMPEVRELKQKCNLCGKKKRSYVAVAPECPHRICTFCLVQWYAKFYLKSHAACPICREPFAQALKKKLRRHQDYLRFFNKAETEWEEENSTQIKEDAIVAREEMRAWQEEDDEAYARALQEEWRGEAYDGREDDVVPMLVSVSSSEEDDDNGRALENPVYQEDPVNGEQQVLAHGGLLQNPLFEEGGDHDDQPRVVYVEVPVVPLNEEGVYDAPGDDDYRGLDYEEGLDTFMPDHASE